MLTEEAVSDTPGLDERLAALEELGEPAAGTDVGVEGALQVVNHPKEGLAALGLAEVVTLTGMTHLLIGEEARLYPRMEEGMVIGAAGIYHRPGG